MCILEIYDSNMIRDRVYFLALEASYITTSLITTAFECVLGCGILTLRILFEKVPHNFFFFFTFC